MSRKSFIESLGATCKNWTWSWSFVNEKDRFVIFGAWRHHTVGDRSLILGRSWERRAIDGKKNVAFAQSREHIRLVEEEGYRLFTYPMIESDERRDEAGHGPAKIADFEPILRPRSLTKDEAGWYACDEIATAEIPEEIKEPGRYVEGASAVVAVNAYERNKAAREACIRHWGARCAACDLSFDERYGDEFEGLIHVHHLIPLSQVAKRYEVDPIAHLRPVCPNCHAAIHHGGNLLSIEELRERIRRSRGR